MLRHALKKDDRSGYLQGDGRLLPFADNSFSIVTVAFGIRNIRPREKAFAEFRRVLQPGGIVAILELCQEKRGLSGWLARIHTRFVVPILGGAFARSDAYRYLQTSIAEFPGPGEFAEELKENGLEVMLQKPFGLGAARLFLCRV
jgi:demethylmenaquinone methyltransferase/2-methoxy-6-polyprenyl-1,4-benzoquinol methylase